MSGNKERHERHIALPCGVGDVVSILGEAYPCQIDKVCITQLGITFEWVSYQPGADGDELWNDGEFTTEDIGKTVFLTLSSRTYPV